MGQIKRCLGVFPFRQARGHEGEGFPGRGVTFGPRLMAGVKETETIASRWTLYYLSFFSGFSQGFYRERMWQIMAGWLTETNSLEITFIFTWSRLKQ